ncbi:SET domain-containing protein [Candidatus Albibeggiatoa sp. nov. BB20]|uniref:SET domain-containing protein n=1 Tax=Candidatus Albibeggiatoa sp. nov. BB20 TaxID=3162723 RepID=UPI003365A7BB
MLLVKTYLAASPIHGVGVFAGEFIKKGTAVWTFDPAIDIVFTAEQIEQLPQAAAEFIHNVAVPYPFGADNYCMPIDNAKYMNHSPDCNVSSENPTNIALKDIPEGTELTVNYYDEDHRADADDFK